jgi:hypothetical protein
VIVTVITVRMVQMTIDEIIDMVAVRHCFVPTTGTMLVANLVSAAVMVGRAAVGVFRTDFQDMVLHHRVCDPHRMMQIAVVEIIDMIGVLEGGVAAV